LEDNTYTLKASDLWEVTFENAVKFFVWGTQNIYVYDFNDDMVFGIAEANITNSWQTSTKNIDIISPENWLTIWDNKVKVSWTSDKNHQVKIIVNWTWEIVTMTNDAWIYEKEITDLRDWENTFVAKVLDANGNEVWTSNEVKVRIEKSAISLISVRPIPEEVDWEGAFELEIVATPWLREVTSIINDIVTKIEEKDSWKYIAKVYAPKEEWVYKIDVTLKDELWHEVKELWAWSLKVNKAPVVEVVEEPIEGLPVAEEPITTTEEPIKGQAKDLKIKWLKLVELKSKSVLTWDELKDAKSYNVYKKLEDWNLEFIENVVEPKFEVLIDMEAEKIKYEYFAVKAVAEDEEWEFYEWDLSEATKIQTWPEIIVLLLFSLLIWWLMLVFFRRKT
jgi:hypothetical protein